MTLILTGEASAVVIPMGKYEAEFTKIEMLNGKFGPSLRWYWKIYHDELGEIELTMMSSARLTAATKSGLVYTVLNHGEQIRSGEAVDLEQFIGSICEVHVENKTSAEGVEYSNVTQVLKLVDDTNNFMAAKNDPNRLPF